MNINIRKHTSKLTIAAAVVLTALVTGAISNFVIADVPDQNGKINACYANSGGDLRIIDTENAGACTGSETAINWDESRTTHSYATGAIGEDGLIVESSLRNVTSWEHIVTDPEIDGIHGYCLKLPFTPAMALSTKDAQGAVGIRASYDPNGAYLVDTYCDAEDDAFVRGDSGSVGFSIF